MNCAHTWPAELTPDARCTTGCGLAYSDWSEEDDHTMKIDEGLRRDNRRREDLNRAARDGRNSADPAERAKWINRDEYLGRLS